MRVLITSGGTKVPIDPVRDITNHSRGTFGSKIATEFLNQGCEVYYYVAEYAKTPFTITVDVLEDDTLVKIDQIHKLMDWRDKIRSQFTQSKFRNFDDYADGIPRIISEYKPDMIILAAAVSDYVVDPLETKIRSEDDLKLEMKHAEKIISKVKSLTDAYLVGFKLMVGASDQELEDAAWKSIRNNGCDLVVANEWWKLKSGNHEIKLIWPDFSNPKPMKLAEMKSYTYKEGGKHSLASEVMHRAITNYAWLKDD